MSEQMNEDMLSAYLDGELTDEERATVEARLAESPEWREQLAEIDEVRRLVRGMPVRNAPPGALELPAVDTRAPAAGTATVSPLRRHRRAIAAVAAVAAALVAIVVVTPHRTTTQPSVAALADEHAARASQGEDPVADLAGIAAARSQPSTTADGSTSGQEPRLIDASHAPSVVRGSSAPTPISPRQAQQLVDRALEAAQKDQFRGTMLVTWTDHGQDQTRSIAVFESDGVLHVGADVVLSSADRRLLHSTGGWQLLWAGAVGRAPNPGRKYTFDLMPGAKIAGRAADELAVRLRSSGAVVERSFFDQETGLLLRRDQLDRKGRIVRQVAYTEISPPLPVPPVTPTLPAPGPGHRDRGPVPLKPGQSSLVAPKHIGDGFRLAGRDLDANGNVQLYYSDGVLHVSVFERAADLDWDGLQSGGTKGSIAGHDVVQYSTPSAIEVMWESGGTTYVLVTDAGPNDVTAIVKSFPRERSPSVVERIGHFLGGPFHLD
jgi:anti-sigma factor RsiW